MLIFLVCLALVLFSLQNTEPTTIKLIQGIQLEAPLSVELVIATGLGAVLAWLFNLWSRMERTIASLGEMREIRIRNQRIEKLEEDIERYQAELKEKPSLPSTETLSEAGKINAAEASEIKES